MCDLRPATSAPKIAQRNPTLLRVGAGGGWGGNDSRVGVGAQRRPGVWLASSPRGRGTWTPVQWARPPEPESTFGLHFSHVCITSGMSGAERAWEGRCVLGVIAGVLWNTWGLVGLCSSSAVQSNPRESMQNRTLMFQGKGPPGAMVLNYSREAPLNPLRVSGPGCGADGEP